MTINYPDKESKPVIALIWLLLLMIVGAVVFTLLAYVTGMLVFGTSFIFQSAEILTGSSNSSVQFLKLVQIASTIGTFIVPSIIFARIESLKPASWLCIKPVHWIFILLVVAIMIVFDPMLEWIIEVNSHMKLPGFLKFAEDWMRKEEDQLKYVTIKLLKTNNIIDLLINLLMIAVLPAIGEEFIFRGCLQRIFSRWTHNYHWGIWISAILFSAIHLQFYGFFPRMLLGALFGYLLIWSKTIWIPVTAHFINNASAVIFAYIYQLKGKPLENISDTPYHINYLLIILSLILTPVLLVLFYRISQGLFNADNIKRDDGRLA